MQALCLLLYPQTFTLSVSTGFLFVAAFPRLQLQNFTKLRRFSKWLRQDISKKEDRPVQQLIDLLSIHFFIVFSLSLSLQLSSSLLSNCLNMHLNVTWSKIDFHVSSSLFLGTSHHSWLWGRAWIGQTELSIFGLIYFIRIRTSCIWLKTQGAGRVDLPAKSPNTGDNCLKLSLN